MSYSTLRGVKNLDTLNALPRQWASNFSEEVHVTAAVDTAAPLTPASFALTGIAEGITLTWVNPTHNDDGTPCYDLSDIAIYRSTSSGIDISNDATYDKRTLVDGEAYTFPASDTAQTYYFVITAIDTTGNESAASSELSDTSNKPIGSDPVIPDDATGLIFNDSIGGDGVVEGYAMMGIAFQTPPATVQGLRSIRLWFQYTDDGGTNWRDEDGVADQWTELFPAGLIGFMHKDTLLQTNIGTRAYRYKATFIGEDDTTESSTADTAGGTGTVCAANNDNVVAVSIFASNIVCLGEVTADSIKASTITADKLTFTAYEIGANDLDDIVDGTTYSRVLTTDISAGHILLSETTGDLDDVDDGTTYSKVLTTDISSGHILLSETTGDLDDISDGSTYGKVATTDITAGHITLVAATASININDTTFGNAGIQAQYNAGTPRFYAGDGSNAYLNFDGTKLTWKAANSELDASGNLTCTSATISGNITCSGTSTWTGNSISTTYTAAKCTDANADQTSANTAAAISGQGALATLSSVGASNCDATIISGGKIITGLLTASNITTGTLNASNVTITNLNATSIVAGTITATQITGSALSDIYAGLGTITSGTLSSTALRTATSGARLVIDTATTPFSGTAHALKVYDASNLRVFLTAGSLYMYDATGDIGVSILAGTQGHIQVNQSSGSTNPVFIVDAAYNSYVCYMKQNLVGGAVPVLRLVQDDVSEGFVDFSGSARAAIAGSTNSIGSVRVEINGTVYRLAYYADA